MTEQNTTKIEDKMQKKVYTSPKVEAIGEVRDVTQGAFSSGSDNGQPSGPEPYDPH